MKYASDEVIQYVDQEGVRFIRLAFCDVFGCQKNIAILPAELPRAFSHGIAIDASAISGFGGEVRSDLLLIPDSSTLASLPWRSEDGSVVRMFCNVMRPDGCGFEGDSRAILEKAVEAAKRLGISFGFGAEMEFYLFRMDEDGEPTRIPYDNAGYMDIAPEDRCENVRREVCLTLSKMGIHPESAHHEEGPGQNEIDFKYSDPLSAADNAITFRTVVKTIAAGNGVVADFSPKPLPGKPGSGLHINISAHDRGGRDVLPYVIAGIMKHIREITVFLNPSNDSYLRLGANKAPRYISWSSENRSQLIRIPAAPKEGRRAELRSPDPLANPYLAFALLIYAGIDGIENRLSLPESADFNFYTAPDERLQKYELLPATLTEAAEAAKQSAFVKEHLPDCIIASYCGC